MTVTQQTGKSFICELWFRKKVIYSQKCFGDKRSALQKATRAREYMAKVCSEPMKPSKITSTESP